MCACLGRGPTDSNSSIPYFGLSVFSVIWGICFSLRNNPNGMKTSDSGIVLAQGTRLLCEAPGVHPLTRQFIGELAHSGEFAHCRPFPLITDSRSRVLA
jgi:hypothetical protein